MGSIPVRVTRKKHRNSGAFFVPYGNRRGAVVNAVPGARQSRGRPSAVEARDPIPVRVTKNDKSKLVRNERSVRICFLSETGLGSAFLKSSLSHIVLLKYNHLCLVDPFLTMALTVLSIRCILFFAERAAGFCYFCQKYAKALSAAVDRQKRIAPCRGLL